MVTMDQISDPDSRKSYHISICSNKGRRNSNYFMGSVTLLENKNMFVNNKFAANKNNKEKTPTTEKKECFIY